ncbi:Subtilisin-like protease SBT1.5, partial [Mucuna pruriens]
MDNKGDPVLDESIGNVSSVFDYGVGHVHPEKAMNSNLRKQYGKRRMFAHFIRIVTNVGDPNSMYNVTIKPPGGMVVIMQPKTLTFRRLSPRGSSVKNGSIVWSDGKHIVASPLVVTMQQPL